MNSDLESPDDGEVKKIVDELDLIIFVGGGAGTNADRAEALALKAAVYRLVAFILKEDSVDEGEKVASELDSEDCDGDVDCGDLKICDDESKKCVEFVDEPECTGEKKNECGGGDGKIGYCDNEKCKSRDVLLSDIKNDSVLKKVDNVNVKFTIRANRELGGELIFTLSNIDDQSSERLDGLPSDNLENKGYYLVE